MKVFSIPFFVIGRRITISLECRLRGTEENPNLDRSILVFEYDSADANLDRLYRNGESFDFALLCAHAYTRIGSFYKQLQREGYWLNAAEKRLSCRSGSALQLYQAGYGDRQSLTESFLNDLWEIGRVS